MGRIKAFVGGNVVGNLRMRVEEGLYFSPSLPMGREHGSGNLPVIGYMCVCVCVYVCGTTTLYQQHVCACKCG